MLEKHTRPEMSKPTNHLLSIRNLSLLHFLSAVRSFDVNVCVGSDIIMR